MRVKWEWKFIIHFKIWMTTFRGEIKKLHKVKTLVVLQNSWTGWFRNSALNNNAVTISFWLKCILPFVFQFHKNQRIAKNKYKSIKHIINRNGTWLCQLSRHCLNSTKKKEVNKPFKFLRSYYNFTRLKKLAWTFIDINWCGILA